MLAKYRILIRYFQLIFLPCFTDNDESGPLYTPLLRDRSIVNVEFLKNLNIHRTIAQLAPEEDKRIRDIQRISSQRRGSKSVVKPKQATSLLPLGPQKQERPKSSSSKSRKDLNVKTI